MTTEVFTLTVLEVRILNPRVCGAMLPPRALGEIPSFPLCVSGGSWWLLDLWQHNSSFCLCLHIGVNIHRLPSVTSLLYGYQSLDVGLNLV